MAKWCGKCQVVVLTFCTLLVATWMTSCEGKTAAVYKSVVMIIKQTSLNSGATCVWLPAEVYQAGLGLGHLETLRNDTMSAYSSYVL